MQHLVRKSLGWAVLVVVLIALIGAWPTRDHELSFRLSKITEEKPVELYDESLFCTVLPDCFRVANKAFVGGARVVLNAVVEGFNAFPGWTVTPVPGWASQYSMNLGPYVLFRIVVLTAIALALRSYFRRWVVVGLVSIVVLWWSTGAPIRAAVTAYGHLVALAGDTRLGEHLKGHFSQNSNIFLLEYDYLALALLLMFPLWLQGRILRTGNVAPLLFGLALAMTFEHLAVVYIVALLVVSRHDDPAQTLRSALKIAVGWGSFIVAMILYARITSPEAGIPLVKITELGYRINRDNDHEWLIIRFVFGFLGIPYLIGVLLGSLLNLGNLLSTSLTDVRKYIHAVLLGLGLSYLVGFFHSALITEFGRQTIAAQVLLLISGTLKFAPASSTSSTSASAAAR